jgi:hypothetical protein
MMASFLFLIHLFDNYVMVKPLAWELRFRKSTRTAISHSEVDEWTGDEY